MKEKEPRRSQTDKHQTAEYRYLMPGLLLAVAPFLVTFILQIISYYADFAIVTALNTYLGWSIEFDEESYIGGNMPSNAVITSLIYSLTCLVIFGWWYMKICERKRLSVVRDQKAKQKAVQQKTTQKNTHNSQRNESNDQKNTSNGQKKNVSATNNKETAKDDSQPSGNSRAARNASQASNIISNTLSRNILLLVAGGIAFQLFVDSILALIRRAAPKLFTSYDEMIENMTEKTFLLILTVIILGPIAEEIIFRGLTLHFAKTALPIKPAVLFSALLFAIYHGNIIQGIYAFIAGIIFCQIAVRFRSILPAMFLHIVINASAYFIPDFLFREIVPAVLILIMSCIILYFIFLKLVISRNTTPDCD